MAFCRYRTTSRRCILGCENVKFRFGRNDYLIEYIHLHVIVGSTHDSSETIPSPQYQARQAYHAFAHQKFSLPSMYYETRSRYSSEASIPTPLNHHNPTKAEVMSRIQVDKVYRGIRFFPWITTSFLTTRGKYLACTGYSWN